MLANAAASDLFTQLSPDFFDLVIIDECHRGRPAKPRRGDAGLSPPSDVLLARPASRGSMFLWSAFLGAQLGAPWRFGAGLPERGEWRPRLMSFGAACAWGLRLSETPRALTMRVG